MQTKNVNKNKYFKHHFQSTFYVYFDCLMNAGFWIMGSSNGQEMQTKNVNKNKYFEYHFQSTFLF